MSRKKLLVLDVNGLLVDTYFYKEQRPKLSPDGKVGNFYVYQRPHCREFLKFCLENFVVGIWSSARWYNVSNLVDYVFGDTRESLAFCWDQSDCTNTGLSAPDNVNKPIFMKELSKLWEKVKSDLPWNKGDYGPFNTLLIDDTPYKAILNPPNTAIFPCPYVAGDLEDSLLGNALQDFLKGVCNAGNVQMYVEKNPFGEPSITSESPLWGYFSNLVQSARDLASKVGGGVVQVLGGENASDIKDTHSTQCEERRSVENIMPVNGTYNSAEVFASDICDQHPIGDGGRRTKRVSPLKQSDQLVGSNLLSSYIVDSSKDDLLHTGSLALSGFQSKRKNNHEYDRLDSIQDGRWDWQIDRNGEPRLGNDAGHKERNLLREEHAKGVKRHSRNPDRRSECRETRYRNCEDYHERRKSSHMQEGRYERRDQRVRHWSREPSYHRDMSHSSRMSGAYEQEAPSHGDFHHVIMPGYHREAAGTDRNGHLHYLDNVASPRNTWYHQSRFPGREAARRQRDRSLGADTCSGARRWDGQFSDCRVLQDRLRDSDMMVPNRFRDAQPSNDCVSFPANTREVDAPDSSARWRDADGYNGWNMGREGRHLSFGVARSLGSLNPHWPTGSHLSSHLSYGKHRKDSRRHVRES